MLESYIASTIINQQSQNHTIILNKKEEIQKQENMTQTNSLFKFKRMKLTMINNKMKMYVDFETSDWVIFSRLYPFTG